jgi:hypothetical protein
VIKNILILFILVTINLDTEAKLVDPVSYTSMALCRERGQLNLSLVAMFGGRAGYICMEVEDEQ